MPSLRSSGPRRPARASTLALASALCLPALAGCGFQVQTGQVYQPGVGVNYRQGEIDVLSAVVVSDKAGQGTLLFTLVNNSVTRPGKLAQVQVAGKPAPAKPVTVPPNGLVNLAQQGGIQVTSPAVKPSGYVPVRVTFSGAKPASLSVPVVPPTQEYAQYSSGSSGSTSPSPSSTPSTPQKPSAKTSQKPQSTKGKQPAATPSSKASQQAKSPAAKKAQQTQKKTGGKKQPSKR